MQPETEINLSRQTYIMGKALLPDIQELVNQHISYTLNKPINLARIEEEWQTTNPKNEALSQGIQDIVAQRIACSSNSPRLID